jgi:hypothetical protein
MQEEGQAPVTCLEPTEDRIYNAYIHDESMVMQRLRASARKRSDRRASIKQNHPQASISRVVKYPGAEVGLSFFPAVCFASLPHLHRPTR